MVIASGPSLTKQSVELVKKWRFEPGRENSRGVIVTNSSYSAAPWADVLYGMDKTWWDHEVGQAAIREFKGEKVCAERVDHPEVAQGRHYMPARHASNSGAGAISLAAHRGALKIVLLGCDACVLVDGQPSIEKSGGKRHWHGDHPAGIGNAASIKRFYADFHHMAQRYKNLQIVNCSSISRLDFWPKMEVEEALSSEIVRPITANFAARKEVVTIHSMLGLGDNIFQRAFLSELDYPVVIDSPWPQLYKDMPHVQVVPRKTKLRTQAKNIQSLGIEPKEIREGLQRAVDRGRARIATFSYGREPIWRGMEASTKLRPGRWDLPDFGPSKMQGKRYAVLRPCTVRTEWFNSSRNCDARYIAEAAQILKDHGYTVIQVADIEPPHEIAEGELPKATNLNFIHGELSVTELLSLVANASVVVGPVGWIVPAGIASGVNTAIICGGQGKFNHPDRITDPRMDLSKIKFFLPDQFCMCKEKQHACTKEITGFGSKFSAYLDSIAGHGVVSGSANHLL